VNTKFLGLKIDKCINWKNCIEQMMPKSSAACYAIRLMVYISKINIIKSTYYVYFHSVRKYGIFLGGKSSKSGKIFTLKKKIVRIMADA
jgi:hypothetical protein